MNELHPILILQLEGVLQSWGDHSQWNNRDSAFFPSKSAVIGLIGCAMGLERGNPKLVELNNELHIAVRADRPGTMLVDFHTITADLIPTADGGDRGKDKTVLTTRHYLQDAAFTVAIDGSEETLETIQKALGDPVWPICLGRKSCIPSRPVIGRVIQALDPDDALCKVPLLPRHKSGQIECESEYGKGAGYYRTDNLIDASRRQYSTRAVYRSVIREEDICISPEFL